ncbi:hypothetical protein FCV25MIE_05659 [Fagus crenata]
MENYSTFSGRVGFLWFFLGIFLLFGRAKAGENITEPRRNANLGPIQGCSSKDYLTDKGVVDVSPDDVVTYCQTGGCGEHTLAVIKCIHEVKRDFWFANKLKIMDLNDIIINGCRDSKALRTVHSRHICHFTSSLVFVAIFSGTGYKYVQ